MNQITLIVDLNTDSIKSALKLLHAAGKQFGIVAGFIGNDEPDEVEQVLKLNGVEIETNDDLSSLDMAKTSVVSGDNGVDLESETTTIQTSGNIELKNPGGVDLDADGLPHDPRIHGASRLKLKKEGTWKKIKNINTNNPGLVEQVEAELRAALTATPTTDDDDETAAPPPPADKEAAAPPPPVEPEVVKYLHDGKEWTEKQLLAAKWAPAQIAALDVIETKTSNEPMTIADLMEKIPTALVDGTITQDDIDKALAKEGVASMPALYARPDLVPTIDAALFG